MNQFEVLYKAPLIQSLFTECLEVFAAEKVHMTIHAGCGKSTSWDIIEWYYLKDGAHLKITRPPYSAKLDELVKDFIKAVNIITIAQTILINIENNGHIDIQTKPINNEEYEEQYKYIADKLKPFFRPWYHKDFNKYKLDEIPEPLIITGELPSNPTYSKEEYNEVFSNLFKEINPKWVNSEITVLLPIHEVEQSIYTFSNLSSKGIFNYVKDPEVKKESNFRRHILPCTQKVEFADNIAKYIIEYYKQQPKLNYLGIKVDENKTTSSFGIVPNKISNQLVGRELEKFKKDCANIKLKKPITDDYVGYPEFIFFQNDIYIQFLEYKLFSMHLNLIKVSKTKTEKLYQIETPFIHHSFLVTKESIYVKKCLYAHHEDNNLYKVENNKLLFLKNLYANTSLIKFDENSIGSYGSKPVEINVERSHLSKYDNNNEFTEIHSLEIGEYFWGYSFFQNNLIFKSIRDNDNMIYIVFFDGNSWTQTINERFKEVFNGYFIKGLDNKIYFFVITNSGYTEIYEWDKNGFTIIPDTPYIRSYGMQMVVQKDSSMYVSHLKIEQYENNNLIITVRKDNEWTYLPPLPIIGHINYTYLFIDEDNFVNIIVLRPDTTSTLVQLKLNGIDWILYEEEAQAKANQDQPVTADELHKNIYESISANIPSKFASITVYISRSFDGNTPKFSDSYYYTPKGLFSLEKPLELGEQNRPLNLISRLLDEFYTKESKNWSLAVLTFKNDGKCKVKFK